MEPLKIKEIEKYAEDFRNVYDAAWVTHDNVDIVVIWLGDFNPKMQFIFEDIGFTVKSKMATYRKLFDENAVFERSPIIEK